MSVQTPDRSEIEAEVRDAEAQRRYWEEHSTELGERYPDQFVAVLDGEVVASGNDLQELLYSLRAKGVDPLRAWVRFMTTRPRQMIL